MNASTDTLTQSSTGSQACTSTNTGTNSSDQLILKAHHHQLKLMGCRFVLTAVSHSPQLAWDAIRAGVSEIERIEEMISSWKESSYTSLINSLSGIRPVKVPQELYSLIERSIRLSGLTFGAFDICGTLSRDYWSFDGKEHPGLGSAEIEALRERMDYRKIKLNPRDHSVYLQKGGMKIGFGGIGKGYAALRAKVVMEQMGIEAGLINASGDLMAWGSPPQGGGWEVMVRDPENRDRPLIRFSIPYGSVVTSGNYENYTIVDGRRLSHIVDPRTGWPVEALKCVSVLCSDPEIADALATAISVMGIEDGLAMVNRLRGIECLIIDKNNQQYFSDHLKALADVKQ